MPNMLQASIRMMAAVIVSLSAYTASAQNPPPEPNVGPTFDCTTHISPLAQLICASPNLGSRQLQLMQARQALSQQLGDPGSQWLKDETNQFYSRLLEKCQVPREGDAPPLSATIRSCIATEYEAQHAAWMSVLGPGATAEANRPAQEHIALQRALQTLGFLSADASIDGFYGRQTRSSIVAWQLAQGLPVTGLLDDASAAMLSIEAADAAQFGPSFDCSEPADTVRQLICANRELSLEQLRFVQVEEAFFQQLGNAGTKLAKDEATKFYAKLDNDCELDSNEDPPS
jgi:uncharacterized protein